MKFNIDLYKQAMEHKVNHQGICYLLKAIRRAGLITYDERIRADTLMVDYLIDVGMYSQSTTYPLGGSPTSAAFKFISAQATNTLWSKHTKYGQTRKDVFKAVLDKINEQRQLNEE